MSKLTDTQLIILSAASQRDDRGVELPANVKGRAARKVAEENGWRNLERDQDGREVCQCGGKRVVVGIAIVLGSAVATIIERQHKPRLGRVGCQRHCQGMKVGCSAGETR